MDRTPSEERPSRSDRERDRAASREVLPGMLLLLAAFGVMLATDGPGWGVGNAVYAALMVVGVGLVVRAEARRLRRADEYQRVRSLEALAFGYVVVVLLLFVAGLADSIGVGDPRIALQATFIIGLLTWSGALAVQRRRA